MGLAVLHMVALTTQPIRTLSHQALSSIRVICYQTKTGWTAGAGAEWAFTRNWTAKIEYLHYDLGDEATIANGVRDYPGARTAAVPRCSARSETNGRRRRILSASG